MVEVIAEAGQGHEASSARIVDLTDLAAGAGVSGIKWQLLVPNRIAAQRAGKYWHDDGEPTDSQRDAFNRAGWIPYESPAWIHAGHAAARNGLSWGASAFDLHAVGALDALDADFVKIASGDLTHKRLVQAAAATGRRLIVSTGAADDHEIQQAAKWVADIRGGHLRDTVWLACTLSYPTPAHEASLARIETLRWLLLHDWQHPQIGYSDHTSDPETARCAAAMGATVLEVHFTDDNDRDRVPDHKIAADPDTLARYVQAARDGEARRGNGRLSCSEIERPARQGARRSLYTAKPIRGGQRWTRGHLVELRPHDDNGLEPSEAWKIIGRTAYRDYDTGVLVPQDETHIGGVTVT